MDTTGFLWVGTNKSLSRFDGKGFIHYYPGEGPKHYVGRGMKEFVVDTLNRIWFSNNSAINRFNPETGTFSHFFYTDRFYPNIDSKGTIWAFSPNKFWVFHQKADSFVVAEQFKKNLKTEGFYNLGALCMHIDRSDNIWVGFNSRPAKAIRYTPKNRKVKYFTSEKDNVHSIWPEKVRNIYEDMEGRVWMFQNNMSYYDTKKDSIYR